MQTPILMAANNPKGWPLETLMVELQAEMRTKDQRILEALPGCKDEFRRAVYERATCNNKEIISLLHRIEQLQRDTLRRLDELGPDQGPRGVSRLAQEQGNE